MNECNIRKQLTERARKPETATIATPEPTVITNIYFIIFKRCLCILQQCKEYKTYGRSSLF